MKEDSRRPSSLHDLLYPSIISSMVSRQAPHTLPMFMAVQTAFSSVVPVSLIKSSICTNKLHILLNFYP